MIAAVATIVLADLTFEATRSAGAIVVVVFFAVRWSMTGMSIVLEGWDAIQSLFRSQQLVRGRWWGVFGTFVLFGLAMFGLQLVVFLFSLVPGLGEILGFLAKVVVVDPLRVALAFAVYQALRMRERRERST